MPKYSNKVTTFAQASQNFATIDKYIRALNKTLANWHKNGVKDLAKIDTRKLRREFPKGGPGGGDSLKPPPKWP